MGRFNRALNVLAQKYEYLKYFFLRQNTRFLSKVLYTKNFLDGKLPVLWLKHLLAVPTFQHPTAIPRDFPIISIRHFDDNPILPMIKHMRNHRFYVHPQGGLSIQSSPVGSGIQLPGRTGCAHLYRDRPIRGACQR